MKNPVFLECVIAEENGATHNRFYNMIQQDELCFLVEYGGNGVAPMKKKYPMTQWDNLYQQKTAPYNEQTKKGGYVDVSENFNLHVLKTKKYKNIENEEVELFMQKILKYTCDVLQENYSVTSTVISIKAIEKAESILDALSRTQSLESFNSLLIELFQILPRRMKEPLFHLAKTTEQFSTILDDEYLLFDTIKESVLENERLQKEKLAQEPKQTVLEANQLQIIPITEDEKQSVLHSLGCLTSRVTNIYKVTNLVTEEKYIRYKKERNIKDNDCRLLFHGSPIINWWGIIKTGLVCYPNTRICCKNFGYGIYFSPEPKKSYNYTYSTQRTSKNSFMGIFEVAVGKKLDVYSSSAKYRGYTQQSIKNINKDSLHAYLSHEEIVVYHDDASTIRYVVELN